MDTPYPSYAFLCLQLAKDKKMLVTPIYLYGTRIRVQAVGFRVKALGFMA